MRRNLSPLCPCPGIPCKDLLPPTSKEASMSSRLNPYISFDGDARQAMEFYPGVLGGELAVNTFGEYGQPASWNADKIMHSQLETPAGFTVMGADTPAGMEYNPGTNIAIG